MITQLPLTEIVSHQHWQSAIEDFREKEKKLMRQQDALNAERRRLPVEKIEKHYQFDGPNGKVSLKELFAGRSQLIVYHFMYGPDSEKPCVGCSLMVDNMGHQAHLEARNTSRVLISKAPLPKLLVTQQRMGWTIPWYSSFDSSFNQDFGLSTEDGEMFGVSVFITDGEHIYRSYFTQSRGAEPLASNWSYLDITPFGRQEAWENSPMGTPQTEPYSWWNYHDSYGATEGENTCAQCV
jgi:predicted dithiol-disulfide oxidoreductase (DUF899 family)